MKEVPKEVGEAFVELKRSYPFFVALHVQNGKFYVYRQSTRWDREKRKVRSTSEYLGRIMPDGRFVGRLSGSPRQQIASMAAEPKAQADPADAELSEIDAKLLTALSMNARPSLKFLSGFIGLKSTATQRRVKLLEQRFGIRYIAEIDVEKLGYSKFIITANFKERIPLIEEIRQACESNPNVQLAALTKGAYDAVIYAFADSNETMAETMVSIRSKLAKYPSEWNVSYFYESSNFVPLRDEFVELLKGKLLKREYAVLKELNRNGTESFVAIDRRYGFDEGRSQFTYHKLREKGIIKRITLSMDRPPVKYIGIMKLSIIEVDKFAKSRSKLLLRSIKETRSPLTNFLLSGDVGNSDGVVYVVPVLHDGYLEELTEDIAGLKLGVRISTLVVTKVLVGSFCYRRFDYAYTNQYKSLVEKYGFKPVERVDYEQTERKKKQHITYNKELGIRNMPRLQ